MDRPERISASQMAELRRRQRIRNWAMLAALLFLAVLFYFIAMVKMRTS